MRRCVQCDRPYPDVLERCPLDGAQLPGAEPREEERAVEIRGAYTVTRLLGEGQAATVHEAAHAIAGHTVALKRARPGAPAAAQEGLALEARVLGRLRHPSVVRLLDAGVTRAGDLCLVLERLEGPTLGEALTGGGLSPERTLRIGRQIARALLDLHHQHVAHFALKASDVILTTEDGEGDRVKLIDFGEAHVDGRHPRAVFMDIWALSALVHRMLTGVPPGTPGAPELPPPFADWMRRARSHERDLATGALRQLAEGLPLGIATATAPLPAPDEALRYCPRCGGETVDTRRHASPGRGVCARCGTVFSVLATSA